MALMRLGVMAALALALTGCGDAKQQARQSDAPASAAAPALPPPSQADYAAATAAAPADPKLAAIYERSCKNCHATQGGAPLATHAASWAPRLAARGKDGLLTSARKGYNAMPAMGMCPDCSDADLAGLISFMSGEGK